MKRLVEWVKRECFHVIPAFLFFFISFYLVNLTEDLLLRAEGIKLYGFVTVLLAAAIVAKVILVVDHLPFIKAFSSRPFIWNTLWKTGVYGIGTLIFRFFERLMPFLFKGEGYERFLHEVHWPVFWAIQIWYLMLFFVFVFGYKLVEVIGPKKVRKMFFGK